MIVSELPNKNNRHIYTDFAINQFLELGFEDNSWRNDLVDSIGLEIITSDDLVNYYRIMLANSKVKNEDMEQFDTCCVEYYENDEWICTMYETDDITELLSMFKSYSEGK